MWRLVPVLLPPSPLLTNGDARLRREADNHDSSATQFREHLIRVDELTRVRLSDAAL